MLKRKILMLILGFVIFLLIISSLLIYWGLNTKVSPNLVTEALLEYHWGLNTKVNSNFATEALLEYDCGSINISAKATNVIDIWVLKKILKGDPTESSPSCGFGAPAITMTDGNKSITFYPASDGCAVLRVGDTYEYITGNLNEYIDISESAREILNKILKKYGIINPRCF
ncbi:MAG: hypothetical protein LBH25_14520 [Fibromonadaceae bacterium]|jgi:hypothetical protein|nr:hypothetical protein [Fibromonadaceae bacterium]